MTHGFCPTDRLYNKRFMKRIACPKCGNYITFDETKYETGQSLVFVCDNCSKQFGIRLGKTKLKEKNNLAEAARQAKSSPYGSVNVVENVFCYKQVFPLAMGDNLIGRKNPGSDADIQIETSDPSMDRRHCYVNVSKNKSGELIYKVRDNDSITGTFVGNELLGPKDNMIISDGVVVTIGATSLILKAADSGSDE